MNPGHGFATREQAHKRAKQIPKFNWNLPEITGKEIEEIYLGDHR